MVQWLYLSGLVLAMLIPPGWQAAPEGLDGMSRIPGLFQIRDIPAQSRWKSYGSQSIQSSTSERKRHSEGTFSSDFTRYLDRMKAKDFVHWLINTKRYN